MSFAVCDLSNDLRGTQHLVRFGFQKYTYVESKILKPFCEVADSIWLCIEPVCLIQEDLNCLIDTWLVLNQLTH